MSGSWRCRVRWNAAEPAAPCRSSPITYRLTTTSSTSIFGQGRSSRSAAISAVPKAVGVDLTRAQLAPSARSSGRRHRPTDPEHHRLGPTNSRKAREAHTATRRAYIPEGLAGFCPALRFLRRIQQPRRLVLRFAAEKDLLLIGMITSGQ